MKAKKIDNLAGWRQNGGTTWNKGTHIQTNNTLEVYRKNGGKSGGLKGSIPWNKGIPATEEAIKKLVVSRQRIPIRNWKGGITPEIKKIRNSIESRLWREAVFARDNWTCQKYGAKGCKLASHHINNFADFPELRFAIDNGITLSDKAHKEFHKKYGVKNNTRKQLEEFLCRKLQ